MTNKKKPATASNDIKFKLYGQEFDIIWLKSLMKKMTEDKTWKFENWYIIMIEQFINWEKKCNRTIKKIDWIYRLY